MLTWHVVIVGNEDRIGLVQTRDCLKQRLILEAGQPVQCRTLCVSDSLFELGGQARVQTLINDEKSAEGGHAAS